MKRSNKFLKSIIGPTSVLIDILLIIIFTSCMSTELRVSEFRFSYNNQNYVVRSAYCPGNPNSFNQLIGDHFVAIDMNQDRIIDKITPDGYTLAEAQKIYDFCLNFLEKKDKLNRVEKYNEIFSFEDSDYIYEIKTFYPKTGLPFNEFTIKDKEAGKFNIKISVLLDEEADGILNKLLIGDIYISDAQKKYNRILKIGLARDELVNVNGSIHLQ